jgi:hypothetical protein
LSKWFFYKEIDMRRKMLGAFAIALVAMAVLLGERAGAAGPADFWGPIHYLRTTYGYEVVPLHLARLCDGRTLLMGFDRGKLSPGYTVSVTAMVVPQTLSQVVAAPSTPLTRTLTKMNVPLDKPFDPANPSVYHLNVCGYAAFTESGSLKVGGMSQFVTDTRGTYIFGLPYSIELNPAGTTWQRLPNEFVGVGEEGVNWRWYANANQVADPLRRLTQLLIVGGSILIDPKSILAPPEDPTKIYWPNDSIELDDGSGTNKLVVAHEHGNPDIRNGSGYPHVIRQPDGRQLIHGAAGRPVTLSIDGGVLSSGLNRRPGPDVEHPSDTSSTSPLSMYWGNTGPYPNGSFITCGGKPGTAYESSCDVYNSQTGAWRHFEMGVKRSWPTTKLLPDGRVAIMGGVASDGSPGQGKTQVFDPVTNTIETGTSEMVTKRGYHTTSVLQNDGSVFLCAGIPIPFDERTVKESLEASTCQAYWPDYVWKPKPYIAALPTTMALGATVDVIGYVGSNNFRPITDARLMPLPTDTHGFDSGQGNVQLKVVRSVPIKDNPNYHIVTLQLPQAASGNAADTAHILPPGCYTLTLIDDQKVPSPGMKTKVVW